MAYAWGAWLAALGSVAAGALGVASLLAAVALAWLGTRVPAMPSAYRRAIAALIALLGGVGVSTVVALLPAAFAASWVGRGIGLVGAAAALGGAVVTAASVGDVARRMQGVRQPPPAAPAPSPADGEAQRARAAVAEATQLRALLGTVSDIVWMAGGDGAFVVPQPAWERWTGQPWVRHRGFGWADVVHPADRDVALAAWSSARAAATTYHATVRCWHAASGAWRHCESWAVPSIDDAGRVREWLGMTVDVEARGDAEAALRRTDERLQLALHVGGIATFDYDVVSGRMTWSDSHYALLGMQPGALVPTQELFLAHVHRDDRALLVAERERAERTREEMRVVFRVVRADGDERWWDMRARFTYDDVGRAVRLAGAAHDITESRRAESTLEERTALLQVITEGATELIFVVDRDGRLRMGNRAFFRAWGRPAAAMLGRTREELFGGPARNAAAVEADRRVLASGTPETVEETLELPGGPRTFAVTRTAQRDPHGQIVGVIGIATDVTAQHLARRDRDVLLHDAEHARADAERARAAAESASRAKDDFLAMLSHELRSPLTATLGWVSLLKRGLLDPTRARDAVERIERSVRVLAQLVNDLLDVSRIVSGKLIVERDPLDLAVVVEQALDGARGGAEARGVRLEASIAPLPAPVVGDALRLQQVATNLLLNAIKFTPEGGRVRVRLGAADDEAVLTVSDTGRGIDPAFVPQLFHRFTQSDGRSARDGGLGLGLFIVQHLVTEHGGSVSCDSAGGATGGATFTVRLPLARERAMLPVVAATADAVTPLAGIRVLLVEDDEDTRTALELALAGAGAEVFAAETAREALALFEHAPPRVVVSDLGMPGEDGYWLVERLRATSAGRTMPIVALTGFASRQDAERAIAAGFTVHVAKPADPDRLVRVVTGLVGRARRTEKPAAPV